MEQLNKNSKTGIISIIFGIFGLLSYLIGWIFFSFVDNRLYGIIIGLILSIIAIVTGYMAKKQGDKNGIYGMYIGLFTIILFIIMVILVTPTSVEFGYY